MTFMHPMRRLVVLLEQELSQAVFKKAARELDAMIDWSGGDGESVYYLVRQEIDPGLPEEYEERAKGRFNRAYRYWALATVEEKFDELRQLFRNNKIKVWREITAPANWKPDEQHPGLYWSWEESAAEAHWGDFRAGNVKWLITAEIEFQNIDWPVTLAANAQPSYEQEKEIRLIDGRPVHILRVQQRKSRFG